MIDVREATCEDGAEVAEFLLRTSIAAGTEFALDRRPDFTALLRLRGTSRTFIATAGGRMAGIATALWHDALDGGVETRVGEIVDLRVAPWARGGRAAFRLLQSVHRAFDEARVDWATCLIGDRNDAARGLVRGHAGLPSLQPLTAYVSVHFIAQRMMGVGRPRGLTVRRAGAGDGEFIHRVHDESTKGHRVVGSRPLHWPDPDGAHWAWLAFDANERFLGGLVVWGGTGVRQIRVTRYSASDELLRIATRAAGRMGVAVPLPALGGVLRMWGSRWFAVDHSMPDAARALVAAAIRQATTEGLHVVQINLPVGDPLLQMLPRAPRATYRSTLYGCALTNKASFAGTSATWHAEPALV